MVGESFEYAKEVVVGKWNKWLMLIIATLLLGLPLMGYMMKVLRGEKPAPEVEDWGTLFIDGIKYLIVALIYAIPLIIVWVIVLGASAVSFMSGDATAMMAAFGAITLGLVIMFILGVIIAVFEVIGIVRFARTGSIGEAFNFNAILATIGKAWLGSLYHFTGCSYRSRDSFRYHRGHHPDYSNPWHDHLFLSYRSMDFVCRPLCLSDIRFCRFCIIQSFFFQQILQNHFSDAVFPART